MIKAGLDSFTVDDNNRAPMIAAIKAALAQGLITESDIDTAVRHALSVRFRLGEFDPGGGPYARSTTEVHQQPGQPAARPARPPARRWCC